MCAKHVCPVKHPIIYLRQKWHTAKWHWSLLCDRLEGYFHG